MARQLAFDLPPQVSLGRAAFFVSSANAEAYAQVTGAAAWPQGRLVVTGPEGSGKSHLLRVWQESGGGAVWESARLVGLSALPGPGIGVALDDADRLPADAEEPLFHLINHLAATGGRLLLAGREAPARWRVALPDLASRLAASGVAAIRDPDDRLLAAVLAKHFADRQIAPPPDLIPYLVARIERSFAAAEAVVARLDAEALAAGRALTRPFAAAVLERGAQGSLDIS